MSAAKVLWVVILCTLGVLIARAEEPKPAKLSEIPPNLLAYMKGSGDVTNLTFYRLPAAPPRGKWRVVVVREGKVQTMLVLTTDRVVGTETNTAINSVQVTKPSK